MIHKALVNGRWQEMTLAEQLGNVGSEFERALSWKQRGAQDKFQSAFDRFLELIDLTVSDPRWRGLRRRELARVREESISLLAGSDNIEASGLQKYFLRFALLSRTGR